MENKLGAIKPEYVLMLILSIIGLFNLFHYDLIKDAEASISEVVVSIGLLSEIRDLLISSSHLPLIGVSASHIADSLLEVVKYLSWSDMIITAQLLLMKISKSVIIKIILILAFGGMFVSSYRSISLKILVILLLINPGLPAYVTLSNYISQEVKLNDGANLHNKIQEIHQKYAEKDKERQQAESQRNQRQLQQAQEKGKKGINGVKKLEDKVLDDGANVVNKVEEAVSEGIANIKAGGKELLILAINYIVTVAIQFLLLPFLFLYGVLQLIKRFLNHGVTENFLHKIILLLFIMVLISGTTRLFAGSTDKSKQTTDVAKPIDKKASQVLGIDVSHFQKEVNWEEIKKAGISFVYTKATQSVGFVDPKFKRNWNTIKTSGLCRGTYHFYMTGEDPKAQAELFIKTVGKLEEGDLPPMLDLEEGGMKPGIDPSKYRRDVLIWLDRVEKALGKKPIIYTDHPFGSKYLTDPKFGKYGLWIADWEKRTEPLVPDAWKGHWTIWQRTQRGKIEGAIGNVDHDLLNGGQKELEELK